MKSKPKCDGTCLDKIREKLAEQFGPVELETSQTINLKTGEFSEQLPPLRFTYQKGKKRSKSHVRLAWCAICGKQNY